MPVTQWICVSLALSLVSCDRKPPTEAVDAAPTASASAAAPKPSETPDSSPPSVIVARAKAGSSCGKTPAAGLACEDGLECFEAKPGGEAGVCAERFEVEPLLEAGKRLKGHWIGLRKRKVGIAGYSCASIRCQGNERCIPCAALMVLEDPYGKLFLVKRGAQLLCKTRKGHGLPMETPRCDMPRGEYAVVVGRLVEAGFRWAKLDLDHWLEK